jgi:hypothetical protein
VPYISLVVLWTLKGHYLPNRNFLLPVKTIRYD